MIPTSMNPFGVETKKLTFHYNESIIDSTNQLYWYATFPIAAKGISATWTNTPCGRTGYYTAPLYTSRDSSGTHIMTYETGLHMYHYDPYNITLKLNNGGGAFPDLTTAVWDDDNTNSDRNKIVTRDCVSVIDGRLKFPTIPTCKDASGAYTFKCWMISGLESGKAYDLGGDLGVTYAVDSNWMNYYSAYDRY